MTDICHMQFGLTILPPPLSACFVNVARNGRKDSDRYKKFKAHADSMILSDWPSLITLKAKQKAMFMGDVRVTFTVLRPDRRARDLDNLTKALCDLLTRNAIIKDDSNIVDLRIRWGEPLSGSVFIEIDAV